MKFKDTIGIFPNAFTESECNSLISKFDYENDLDNTIVGASGQGINHKIKRTKDYEILHTPGTGNASLSSMVMKGFNKTLSDGYLENYPHGDMFDHHFLVNGKCSYPLLQIQKYDQNEGHYNAWHVEKEDMHTSRRLFVFILYLNTVEKGGETGFLFKEEGADDYFKVKPETGKLIIHPASWPYIHKGYMPESNDKYILTTWLEFTV
jgi:hypothetical protein